MQSLIENAGQVWGFSTAARIFFGWGAAGVLRDLANNFGTEVLLCADKNIAASGAVETAREHLEAGGARVTVFAEGTPDVDLLTIEKAAGLAANIRPDVIIGLGGGSNMDLAKACAILNRHPGPLSKYYGEHAVPGPITPVVAIPTTAGTGSEVSPVAVVSDPDRPFKVGIASRRLIPIWAVVDPSLTLSCPPSTTAHSGADALTHAIEAFTAIEARDRSPQAIFVGKNPISDACALKAIELIGGSLRQAVTQPDSRKDREAMSLGSLLAGMAFSSAGTAGVHALQYPIGEATHTPHGLGNALLLPHVMRRITPARIREMAVIARCLDARLHSVADEVAAEQAARLVESLICDLGIRGGLKGIGLPRTKLAEMAAIAAGISRLINNSPLPLNEEALLEILESAYEPEHL